MFDYFFRFRLMITTVITAVIFRSGYIYIGRNFKIEFINRLGVE